MTQSPLSFYGSVAATLITVSSAMAATSVAVSNPSFEADNFGNFPGYLGGGNPGAVTGWSATAGGINGDDIGAGAPFINGLIADGHRAAFIQGPGSFSQNISGFTTGTNYLIQGVAIARNCCGDVPVATVTMGSSTLVPGVPITNNTWAPFSLPWTANSTSGVLSISSAPQNLGDAALGFDAIHVLSLAPGEVPIFNPNFEAGGVNYAFPGYVSAIAGWDKVGGGQFGYNYAGNSPFADNGAYPEGQAVAFLQNDVTISQNIGGLTVGQQYMLDFYYNARDFGDNAWLSTSLNGSEVANLEVVPVGGANAWHHFSHTFTASSASLLLALKNDVSHGQADASLLLDGIRLQAVPEPTSALLAAMGLVGFCRRRRS